jgi:predicted small lipoprotein YifL
MKRTLRWLAVFALIAVAGCGPTRKSVFPPATRIQELHIAADGSWQITLRLTNNSYTGMRFQSVQLAMDVDGHPAGTLQASPDLDIPQFAADVVQLTVHPDGIAAQALTAIANKGSSASIGYRLKGMVTALPDDEKKPRTFQITHRDWLSPVPGIDNTFR